MRVRRLDWGPGEEASASSNFDGGGNAETVAASGASGLVARMAVQRAGSIGNPLGLGRSWSANDRAGPSPLSEASGPSGAQPEAWCRDKPNCLLCGPYRHAQGLYSFV